MLAVTVLSWLTVDLKKKTENGHCHNPVHTQAENTYCSIGSQFHKQLCSDYINILEDFHNNWDDDVHTPQGGLFFVKNSLLVGNNHQNT
jgi:hypothetical protein